MRRLACRAESVEFGAEAADFGYRLVAKGPIEARAGA